MSDVGLLQGPPTAGDVARRLARLTARGSSESSETSVSTSRASVFEVRGEVGALGATLRHAVTAVSREVTAAAEGTDARALVSPLVAAIETVNEVLDTLDDAQDVPSSLRSQIFAAVSATLAGVPNAATNGLTFARVDGKERLVVDTEALAAALSKDPNALDPLVNGEQGLSETLNAVLTANTDAGALASELPAPSDPPSAADSVQSARLLAQMRTLQLLESWPSTSRHRLELLV